MNHIDQRTSRKIADLNQTTLDSLTVSDPMKIVEHFTEAGIRILEADFGFAWWRTSDFGAYDLAYKSEHTPYEPKLPRERGGNFLASKTRLPFFVEKVSKRNYEKRYDVSPYMDSYVIIPITYRKHIYGNIVLCYKKSRIFDEEDRALSVAVGNATAQSITIFRLVAGQYERAQFDEEKQRTQFMADATHELRTPLAIIKGNVDLALRSGLKSLTEARSTLQAIDQEVRHITRLISDMAVLANSKKPSHRKFITSKVNILTLVRDVMKRCRTLAAKKNISIRMYAFPDISLDGDRTYLAELFTNIIKNAIIYGVEGGYVEIRGSKKDRMIHVDISDNGCGIPKESLPHIFGRFYRTAEARAKNQGGTGLGLAIAKWAAEAHGGSITVRSIEHKGSTFRVSLPLIA